MSCIVFPILAQYARDEIIFAFRLKLRNITFKNGEKEKYAFQLKE